MRQNIGDITIGDDGQLEWRMEELDTRLFFILTLLLGSHSLKYHRKMSEEKMWEYVKCLNTDECVWSQIDAELHLHLFISETLLY